MSGMYANACSVIHLTMDDEFVTRYKSAQKKLFSVHLTTEEIHAMNQLTELMNRLIEDGEEERAERRTKNQIQ